MPFCITARPEAQAANSARRPAPVPELYALQLAARFGTSDSQQLTGISSGLASVFKRWTGPPKHNGGSQQDLNHAQSTPE